MNRRKSCPMGVLVILLSLALGVVAQGTAPAAEAVKRPHIVVFLCDDLGCLDTSVYGAKDVKTPNLQRLADTGLTFTQAFIASPACAPSRGAMITGLMPARNGAEANHTYVRAGIKGLPTYMHEVGYEVAAFGKVAHGDDVKRWDFDHFDLKFDLDLVAQYLDQRGGAKLLCLFVGTHDPHVAWTKNTAYDPNQVALPPTFVDTPQTRAYRTDYYTEITRADTDMGTLYDMVHQKLGSRVLFLFSSDHGAQWPFGKWNLYDSSIRTPLIAAWPGVLKAGSKTDAMVNWIDLLTTFVELAGGTPPADIDGRSFAGLLLGRTDRHRDRIFTTHSGDGRMNVYPIRSVRTGRYKYIRNLFPELKHTTFIDLAKDWDGVYYWRTWVARAKTDPRAAAVVHRYHERAREELYDIVKDPYELHNLAVDPAHRDRLKDFRDQVTAWMQQQGDSGKLLNEPHALTEPEFCETPEGASEKTALRKPNNRKAKP